MGKETKVKLLISVVFMLVVGGCNEVPFVPPPPTIEIEQNETSTWAGIRIYFHDHDSNNGTPYIILDTPEKLAQYREQVEFLLNRMDEAERKMNVHEPATEPPQ